MTDERNLREGIVRDSKSRISQLTREIDGLVREYVSSGSEDVVARASKLSREREQLLKPKVVRSGRLREAS